MSTARLAASFYVVTIVAGALALVTNFAWRDVSGAVAGASYVAVTLLFYRLFAPVDRRLSAVAVTVGLGGCALALASQLGLARGLGTPLPVFGVYCGLIGWLIVRSTLPRLIGVLMIVGGLGWLTFASPSLVRALTPYSFAPGILGESVLTLWLLVTGVNPSRRTNGDARPSHR